jgi:hypothetical protein
MSNRCADGRVGHLAIRPVGRRCRVRRARRYSIHRADKVALFVVDVRLGVAFDRLHPLNNAARLSAGISFIFVSSETPAAAATAAA